MIHKTLDISERSVRQSQLNLLNPAIARREVARLGKHMQGRQGCVDHAVLGGIDSRCIFKVFLGIIDSCRFISDIVKGVGLSDSIQCIYHCKLCLGVTKQQLFDGRDRNLTQKKT